jgi:hypothetical protein
MKVHTLDIDSGMRDTNVYPYANTYVVTLDKSIYDVTQIKLISARIPTPQLTICSTNKTFSIYDSGAPDDTIEVTLNEKNYTSGTTLASELQSQLFIESGDPTPTCIDSVAFDSVINTLTFSNTNTSNAFSIEFFDGTNGYLSNVNTTTPHQVLGFSSKNTTEDHTAVSGAINLNGPNSLIIRLSSGSDEFNRTVFSSTPFYTGAILLDGSDVINYHGADDPLTHEFHTGSQKFIKDLKVEFFYMSHGRLIPYDFRNQDHTLKFEVTCSTDKFEALPKVPLDVVDDKKEEEKSEISIPEIIENPYKWKEYAYIGIIVIVGIILMFLMNGRRRPVLSE